MLYKYVFAFRVSILFCEKIFDRKIMEYFRERKCRTFLIFLRAKKSVNLFYRPTFFTEKNQHFFKQNFRPIVIQKNPGIPKIILGTTRRYPRWHDNLGQNVSGNPLCNYSLGYSSTDRTEEPQERRRVSRYPKDLHYRMSRLKKSRGLIPWLGGTPHGVVRQCSEHRDSTKPINTYMADRTGTIPERLLPSETLWGVI